MITTHNDALIARYGTHEVAYLLDKFQEYFELYRDSPAASERGSDACVIALKRSEAR